MHQHNAMATNEDEKQTPIPVIPPSIHILLKHNMSNIFAMLDDIERITPDYDVKDLAINIRKHLTTVLSHCAVAGRCPAISRMN